MFITAAVVTLLSIVITSPRFLMQPIPALDITSLALFWPTSWQGWCLWGLWGIMLLLAFLSSRVGGTPGFKQLSSLGVPGNMGNLDRLLLAGGVVLAALGWAVGVTFFLVPGAIALLGLLGNALEQKLMSD
jgi:hypothetical protein